MALFICREFLVDIRDAGDVTMARRVLSKVLDMSGAFVPNRDDHRYLGIDHAWVRYVSQGGAAYRVIYLRKGPDIYLYRAGPHSIENNLAPPSVSTEFVEVRSSGITTKVDAASAAFVEYAQHESRLLKNYKPVLLRHRVLGRRLIPHKEIILISPFLSQSLFSIFSPLGKVLSDLQQEGTKLTLITKEPLSLADLKFFERLDSSGYEILFHDKLHAKLFLFEPQVLNGSEARLQRLAIVGSANLTKEGLAIPGREGEIIDANEELSYELPPEEFDHALDFATYLSVSARDLAGARIRLAGAKR